MSMLIIRFLPVSKGFFRVYKIHRKAQYLNTINHYWLYLYYNLCYIFSEYM